MFTLEDRMKQIKEGNDAFMTVVESYTNAIGKYVEALWQSLFILEGFLHETCNLIESGEFDQKVFYESICDMLGRPKEM